VIRLAQAWKAVVAFFAPGLLLTLEPLLLDGELAQATVLRAALVATVTSVAVWLKTNAASPDPDTSTPQP
jgi:hypothetical protein